MDEISSILAAIVIALVSGIIGRAIGERDVIKCSICDERRESCQKLLLEKIDNLSDKIDSLAKLVNGKLLGL